MLYANLAYQCKINIVFTSELILRPFKTSRIKDLKGLNKVFGNIKKILKLKKMQGKSISVALNNYLVMADIPVFKVSVFECCFFCCFSFSFKKQLLIFSSRCLFCF
jgi:hypothetical protein